MTLFEAQTGGAFDRLNWQHSGEFDQNFSKKSRAPGFAWGLAWAVLELTGTLLSTPAINRLDTRARYLEIVLVFCGGFRRSNPALCHLLCGATCSFRTDKQLQPSSQGLEKIILYTFCPSPPLCNVDKTLSYTSQQQLQQFYCEKYA